MRFIFYIFSIFCLIALLLLSCETRKEKEETITAAELDSLQTVYTALNDSLKIAWQEMIEDDDQKLTYLRRLLQEITYTNNYDEATVDSLMNMVDQLAELRYTFENMESDLIDQYDSASQRVVNQITSYAYNHPDFDNYPLMNELISDIQEAHQMVFLYRVHYDDFAMQYNEFMEENEHRLVDKDEVITEFKQAPLFQLPADPPAY